MLVEISSYCHHCYLAQLVIQLVQSFFVLLLGSTENKKILHAKAKQKIYLPGLGTQIWKKCDKHLAQASFNFI